MYESEFRPTHVTPRHAVPAWAETSRGQEVPSAWLDPLLPVRVTDRRGDWCRIECSNGWIAWVDGRPLISIPDEPPTAGLPLGRTSDPRPLLARVDQAVGGYRRKLEELMAGRTDDATFRASTRGVRLGVVLNGDEVWLFDAETDRWYYCDGPALATFAATSGPSAAEPPASDQPTRQDGGP
ncbi:hypothetical protein [Streptomyces sp. RPT161]|uniref:hypothetical protein n=1 Tax=Streptomyces sp. RPT161 TaxID=3015993 RepID=UPI0022B901B5|nr:hypothetical protein [Streptomyces sp. RPT161]